MSGLIKPPGNGWPEIIWVAAEPPIPPFTGAKLKALDSIEALCAFTSVHVVTFAPQGSEDATMSALEDCWKGRPVRSTVVQAGRRPGAIEAAVSRRFQWGTTMESSDVHRVLYESNWESIDRLVVLDDIVLAPLAATYGTNAILSPHDCISRMHLSYVRLSPVWPWAIRHYLQHRIALHYEKSFYHHALLVHVVTDRDRVLTQEINPRARFHVAPISSSDVIGREAQDIEPLDLLIWANLATPAIAEGVRRALAIINADDEWKRRWRVGVVGRIDEAAARRVLGGGLSSNIQYASRLEVEDKGLRPARIVLIPDLDGTGIKNRCVSVLAQGRALACLHSQMEGIERAADVGAINAPILGELLECCKRRLDDGSYAGIARNGQRIFLEYYAQHRTQQLWLDIVQRALVIREMIQAKRPTTGNLPTSRHE